MAAIEHRRPQHRALACSVFRGCFDILEMILEDHKASVKGFADEILNKWLPFFIVLLKTKLSDLPSE